MLPANSAQLITAVFLIAQHQHWWRAESSILHRHILCGLLLLLRMMGTVSARMLVAVGNIDDMRGRTIFVLVADDVMFPRAVCT
jgi:hypothetical protein